MGDWAWQNETIGQERVVKGKILVKSKAGGAPDIVDDFVPTVSIRLVRGPGRGTATRGVGSAWLMGSKTLFGSFDTQIVEYEFAASTPNVWFAVVHSRSGTIDTEYLEAKGKAAKLGNWKNPIDSVGPGTIKMYALGPGSSISQGKGSNQRFQGVGSNGNFALWGKILGFQV